VLAGATDLLFAVRLIVLAAAGFKVAPGRPSESPSTKLDNCNVKLEAWSAHEPTLSLRNDVSAPPIGPAVALKMGLMNGLITVV